MIFYVNIKSMKSYVTYDLLIIGGGISACVFATKYRTNNTTKKIELIAIFFVVLFFRYFEAKTHADIPPPIISKSYVKSLFIITYYRNYLSFSKNL